MYQGGINSGATIPIKRPSPSRVKDSKCAFIIIIIFNPLTMRVVGAPQMILQPVFSIFPCAQYIKRDITNPLAVSQSEETAPILWLPVHHKRQHQSSGYQYITRDSTNPLAVSTRDIINPLAVSTSQETEPILWLSVHQKRQHQSSGC